MTIGEVCNRRVVVTRPGESVAAAAREMRDLNVGDLVVTRDLEGQRVPIGIVTDRDIVVKAAAGPAGSIDMLTVSDIMTGTPVLAREHESLFDVLKRMRSHGIRRLPVVNAAGGLEGIFTLDDALDLLAEELSDLVALIAREQRHATEPGKTGRPRLA
ncbi:MAG TPA: CBS domain-containing protein [Vicinamibacterales bacterium]|nr:CBS domain-containing protein [Vicinamibacterales bacterium]